jgi:hypothetical protein
MVILRYLHTGDLTDSIVFHGGAFLFWSGRNIEDSDYYIDDTGAV